MADLELAKFIHSFTEAWMTIFLILGGHLSMSRTWTHPLFCSFSDSSASIRNMPWMHFFDASSNREHNIQIPHHATQSLSIPGIPQHPNLTRCHSLTVHIIHQVNFVSQFLKKRFCVLLSPGKILVILWVSVQHLPFTLTSPVTSSCLCALTFS